MQPRHIANRDDMRAEHLAFHRIPVIDLAAAGGGDRAASAKTAKAIREACINVGFLYIKNHGVPETALEDALAATERFFALPEDVKLKYDIAKIGYHRGYVPVGGLSADPEAVDFKVDLQEGFELGLELPEDDPDSQAGNRIYGPNVWPAELPGFQSGVRGYFDEVLALGRRLFALFALALDLPEDHFDKEIEKPIAQLRLIHYPPAPAGTPPRDAIGIGAHTDYECFTMLWQGGPGLQVQNTAGQWIEAPPLPGTYVINIGDMLQRWTNDLFVSTPQRVISTSGKDRYSLPFFFGANYETVVTCLETCRGPDRPPRYPPTHFGLWAENMYTYAYAYRHADQGKLRDPELA
jgi:isopenicillin N synthase-like dioxygenase